MGKQRSYFSRGAGIVFLALALAISACAKKEERVLFDGSYYPAKAKAASKDDRKVFQVAVRRADQGIKGALEAGRHEGKTYCLKNYGTSEIEWIRGPDDPNAALYASGSGLSLQGTCVLW